MAVLEHGFIKDPKLLAYTAGVLESKGVLQNIFRRFNPKEFVGAQGDTVSYKVPGLAQADAYTWRNDRTADIDEHYVQDRAVSITFGDRIVSRMRFTTEQDEFDFVSNPEPLPARMASAIARDIEDRTRASFLAANFAYTIAGFNADLKRGLAEINMLMTRIGLPMAGRTLVVSPDIAMRLQMDPTLYRADSVGAGPAQTMLTNSTIGMTVHGLRIVLDVHLPDGEAYALVPEAMLLGVSAPKAPEFAPFSAVYTENGHSFRLNGSFNESQQASNMVMTCWFGARPVKDILVYRDTATQRYAQTTDMHYVRAIKVLGPSGTSDAPAAGSELAMATGVDITNVYSG